MKLGLQILLSILSLIPLGFAVLGLWQGAAFYADPAGLTPRLENQFRYLSGVYLIVSMLLWYAIPNIERHFRLLAMVCAALVVGGLGRLYVHVTMGPDDPGQFAGMLLELGSPLFLVWQQAIARSAAR